MRLKPSPSRLASLLATLVLSIQQLLAFSTIRVQVNNDNLQSPPYLLEALKEADKVSNQSQAMYVQANRTTTIIHQLSSSDWSPISTVEIRQPDEVASSVAESLDHLSEADTMPPAELEPHEPATQSSLIVLQNEQPSDGQMVPGKKVSSQLPVTNSHLKKPFGQLLDSDQDETSSIHELSQAPKSSLVSPSVAIDDPKSNSSHISSQGMVHAPLWHPQTDESNLYKNDSNTRNIQSRTRVNLSTSEPNLGDAFSNEERLTDFDQEESSNQSDTNGQLVPAAPEDRPGSMNQQDEPSRVVQVPERIVLTADAPKQVQHTIRLTINRTRLGKPDPRCPPNETTTFEHERHCDKYYFCDEGYKSEHTCPNGLMYGTLNPVKDYCVHRWHAVCLEKVIPNPISSPGCRWQYGIFSVQGSPRCSPDYFECVAGRYEVKKCSIEGQVYDDRSKGCQYAERAGCPEEILSDFQCPPNDQDNVYWPVPRYFLNDRTLVHCINDKPKVIRCSDSERADPENLHCVPINRHEGPVVDRKMREKQRG